MTSTIFGGDGVTAESSLAQYGVLGAVLVAVMSMIVVPLLRAMIAQNAEALRQNAEAITLLRTVVQQNSKAVETFQTLEMSHHQSRVEARQATDSMRLTLDEHTRLLAKMTTP